MPATMSKFFFDQKAVIDALGRDEANRLAKAAMYIKVVAQRSMRPGGKKGKSASPGEPPRYHVGTLRKGVAGVQGWYDFSTRSSVVGATPFPKARTPNGAHILEFGGVTSLTVKKRQFRTRGSGPTRRVIASTVQTTVQARFHAFPYMAPAMRVAIREGEMPLAWEGTLRGK